MEKLLKSRKMDWALEDLKKLIKHVNDNDDDNVKGISYKGESVKSKR